MPTVLKVLNGNPGKRRLNRTAPTPRNVPVRPAGMSAAAQAIWARIVRDYAQTGVLTGVDTDAVRIYCEAVVRYAYAAERLEQSGPLVRSRGELVKNPLHQIVRDNADLVRAFARELGFTPSARSALTGATGSAEPDALDRWLAGKSG